MKTRSLIALAALALAGTAGAQDIPRHPALTDKFWFGAGVFFPETNTQAQLTNKATGVGATVDFEQSLDLERSKNVPTVIGRWRITERWRLDAEYFQLNRSGERVIDRQIEWGDQTFPVNASVATEFNFSDLRVSVGYSFFRRQDKEIGVGLGLHVATYDVSLRGGGGNSEGEDVLAPLPVLSFYGQFALTDTWAVGARLDRFSLSYDKFDGSLTSLGLDLLYQPFKHVGFGVAYRALAVRAEIEGERNILRMRQVFQGPMLFMNASW
jgi:hypothetical protein